ncbi:MAG: SigE family RNA polymerase sigma factor [Actinomycetes bacterium]
MTAVSVGLGTAPGSTQVCHDVLVEGRGVRVGDDARAAFDVFVTVGSTRLLRAAYLLTGDWGHAEDLLQTALAKAWVRWNRLEAPEAAEVYVRRIIFTTYLKWRKRRWTGEAPTESLPEHTVRDEYGDVDERDRWQRRLSGLAPQARAVIVLRFFDDMTEAQIADALGCKVGTVKSTLSRALARLRELEGVTGGAA